MSSGRSFGDRNDQLRQRSRCSITSSVRIGLDHGDAATPGCGLRGSLPSFIVVAHDRRVVYGRARGSFVRSATTVSLLCALATVQPQTFRSAPTRTAADDVYS